MEDVKKLEAVILDTGNPFLDMSNDLIALVTGTVASNQASENVLKIEETGKQKYSKY